MDYVKSPLCYVGGKYKILKDIIPLFPKNITMFVDLFGGGFNVGANVTAKTIVCNDICNPLIEILKCFYETDVSITINNIEEIIKEYNLTKENQNGYLQLREYYNTKCKTPIILYTLICYAFNHQIRFNSKGEYNMPFGKERSSFNDALKQKLIEFINSIQSKNIKFTNNSFEKLNIEKLEKNSFIYCDSPYFNSTAVYNVGWGESQEVALYSLLDKLTLKGIKWGVSNNLQYENSYLQEFIKKYNVINIDHNYNNCNYHKKDREVASKEIYIYNYTLA